MKLVMHRVNSIEAIRKALKTKVDLIEVDLRISGGTVVLSHDRPQSHTVYCPLNQALSELNGKLPLLLDIKDKKVVSKLPALLKNYRGEVTYSSFSFKALQDLRKLLPEARLAVIDKWSSVRAVAAAKLLNTNEIHMNHKWLWHGLITSMQKQGLNIFAYTVNDEKRAKELAEWGVDGIFTDNPNISA